MLSQSAAYAASALAFITAMGGKPVQVRAVSAACEIPAAYLAKIVNVLARKGLVTTQRGVGGGVEEMSILAGDAAYFARPLRQDCRVPQDINEIMVEQVFPCKPVSRK